MSRPYAFINDHMQPDIAIKNRLGAGSKFDSLNTHIRNAVVMPGQIVIVPDSSTPSCTREEAELMQLAQGVWPHIVHNQLGADGLMVKNYDTLQKMLSYGSLGLGSATGAWSKHLSGIEQTLNDIEKLYKLSLTRGTPIARQQFINQRQTLFAKLDSQLKGVARWGSGLHNKGSIKRMLGISTKSYLHTGELQDYASKVGKVSRTARLLKHGTAVGIGLNVTATALEIKEACSTGREDVCEKAKYVEGGKLGLGVSMGMLGGSAGASGAISTCVAVFTIPSGGWGALACGIIGGMAAGYAGGLAGERAGEAAGEVLYKWKPGK